MLYDGNALGIEKDLSDLFVKVRLHVWTTACALPLVAAMTGTGSIIVKVIIFFHS